MLKQPAMGAAKTRLAAEIGALAATWFARVASRTLIIRLARDARWRTLLAIAPDVAASSPEWPAACARRGQGRGDLGARMERLLAPAHRPVLLIGADIPAITPAVIADAFRLLARHDVVLGPAEDGGYWLIGLNRRGPRGGLFPSVRWSTPHALADTVAGFPHASIGYAARLGDVDNAESFRRLAGIAGRVIVPVRASRGASSG